MGVFKKLKDVLFDIEDEDLPVITKKEEVPEKVKEEVKIPKYTEENTIKEIKIPKEDMVQKETPKPESSFNFPLDLDIDEKPLSRSNRGFDFEDEPVRREEPKEYVRTFKETPKPEKSRLFTPTPIISPVYGVLDQNYSKDDIIVKTDTGVKGPDLDEIRKKAYGIDDKKITKKPEIKQTIEETLKSFDDILMEEEIKPEELTEVTIKEEITIKAAPERKPEEEINIDDTIETDLFNLIDSMYENKEESEEF